VQKTVAHLFVDA